MNNKEQLSRIFLCKKVKKAQTIEKKEPLLNKENIDIRVKVIQTEKQRAKFRLKFKSFGPFKNGRWTGLEHEKFLRSCLKFGNNWKKV